MGRTLTQLVQGVGRKMSARSRYVAAAGTGGSGTWTDATNLGDTPVDWYNFMWLYNVTSAKEWRVTDDDGAGVLTLDPTSTPTSTSDYELLPVRPSLIVTAINDAAQRLSSRIGRTRIDNSYVTNSPIFNAGFEETTGANSITGWTATTSTMTRESSADKKLGGAYSVRVDTAAGSIRPDTEFADLLLELRGHSPTLYAHCKTSAVSNARLSWVIDGTVTNGSYHSGGGGWEIISVTSPAIPDEPDTVLFRLNISTTSAAYFDNIWIEDGPTIYYYRLPAGMTMGPSYIRIMGIDAREDMLLRHRPGRLFTGWNFLREEDPALTTTRNVLWTPRLPPWGRWLMVGWEPLSTLSARTDVAEIDEDKAELLEVEAALILLEESQVWAERQRLIDLQRRKAELLNRLPEVLGAAQLS